MNLTFKTWLEMGQHVAEPSNVVINNNGYDFDVDGKHYHVDFYGPYEWKQSDYWGRQILLSRTNYSINFKFNHSAMLTRNTNNPMAVYGEVIKAVKKLIETKNPESLDFFGAVPEQDAMYNIFYKKYLSKGYTRVGAMYYLRNDLYNKYKQENGPEWKIISDLDYPGVENRLLHGKKIRDDKRLQRRGGI